MTYAFTLDASACSGCKACQEACKDKNQLPVGVLWRRVIEVSGGGWIQTDGAWTNDVFAYNLSLACNHCEHPKCADVCPVDAYVVRPDGIVTIDTSRCMGCGYCSWACPYGVPQFHPELGVMTKCNFCIDTIEAGLPPACVAACPLRVLGFAEVSSEQSSVVSGQFSELWKISASEHPFPLPGTSRTQPHLIVKPHKAMNLPLEKRVANREEIKPKRTQNENPLVAFTVLAQLAVGAYWALVWMGRSLSWEQRFLALLVVGVCLGSAGFFSFAHLGAKHNAWRALTGLSKSWLSREVLYVGLFAAGWAVSLLPMPLLDVLLIGVAESIVGAGLLYSMAQVYRLPSMPAWDSRRTLVKFCQTALFTGPLLIWIMLAVMHVPLSISALQPVAVCLPFLAAELGESLKEEEKAHRPLRRLRVGMIALGMVGVGALFALPSSADLWIAIPLFLLLLAEEMMGRWLFYSVLEEWRL